MVSRFHGSRLLACVVGGVALSSPLQAQPEATNVELQAARQIFVEATSDEEAGRWAEALEKFTRIVELRETPSGRYHKAVCEEKLGKLLAAYDDYKRAAELAQSAPPSSNRRLILEEGVPHMADLLQRVPRVKVVVPPDVSGVVARLDGSELAASEVNTPRRVETGDHVVEATAPGRVAYRAMIRSVERANDVVRVELAAASPAAVQMAPIAPLTAERGGASLVPAPIDNAGARSSWGPWLWVGAGASAALAGTSVVFLLRARSAQDDLDEACNSSRALCNRSDLEGRRDRAYLVTGITGGLALTGAGVTVWQGLSTASGAKRTAALQVSPAGIIVRGTF